MKHSCFGQAPTRQRGSRGVTASSPFVAARAGVSQAYLVSHAETHSHIAHHTHILYRYLLHRDCDRHNYHSPTPPTLILLGAATRMMHIDCGSTAYCYLIEELSNVHICKEINLPRLRWRCHSSPVQLILCSWTLFGT